MDKRIFESKEEFKKNWIEYTSKYANIKDTKYLEDIFEKYYKNNNIKLYNSATGKYTKIDSLKLLTEILSNYTIVENGVLFLNHKNFIAPVVKDYNILFNARKYNKGLMKKELANNNLIKADFYDRTQADNKENLNTYYGTQLNPFSKYYNYDVASSITMRGRSTVSMNGLTLEQAFGTYRPYSLEVHIHFINEACKKNIAKYSKYFKVPNDDEILHHLLKDHYENYYGLDILKDIISNLSDEDKKKVYYTSNYYALIENEYVSNLLLKIFGIQNEDYHIIDEMDKNDDKDRFKKYKNYLYLDPMDSPSKIKELIGEFIEIIEIMLAGFYWYEGDYDSSGNYFMSTQEIFKSIDRKIIMITDTDSLIAYLKNMMNAIQNNDIFKDTTKDFSNKMMIKFTVGSIIIATISAIVAIGLNRYTTATLIDEAYRHVINFKQEFFFRTLQPSEGAKNYLGIISIQEGVFLKNEKVDVKGLSLKKSNFNKRLSSIAKDITINLIAKNENPDIRSILDKISDYRNEVIKLYKSKENIELFTVSKLKKNYEELPSGEYRVKAINLYNELFDDKIPLPGSFLLTDISFEGREDYLLEEYPKEYGVLQKILKDRTIDSNYNSLYNKAMNIYSLEDNIPSKIKEFLDGIKKCKMIDEVKEYIKSAKKNDPDLDSFLYKYNIKEVKIKDITKIAVPLDSEEVPTFITEFIDSENMAIFENLSGVIVKGIGLEVVRNSKGQQLITNTVSYY